MGARLGEGHAHEDESGDGHYGADGEVPVRAMVGDGEVGLGADNAVDVESLVSGHFECIAELLSEGRKLKSRFWIVVVTRRLKVSSGQEAVTISASFDISRAIGKCSGPALMTSYDLRYLITVAIRTTLEA